MQFPRPRFYIYLFYSWSTDDLLHDYYDRPDFYLREAGVTERSTEQPVKSDAIASCKVCLEERPGNEFYAMGCNHAYCKECWKTYIQEIATTAGSDITRLSCMFPKCRAKLNENDFEELALPSSLQRYHRFFFQLMFLIQVKIYVFYAERVCGERVTFRLLPESKLWKCCGVQWSG